MWLGPTAKWSKTAWTYIFAGRRMYVGWALMWVQMWQFELQWHNCVCVCVCEGREWSRICFICMNTHLNVSFKKDVHQVLDTLHHVRNTWLHNFCCLITRTVNYKVSSWMGSFKVMASLIHCELQPQMTFSGHGLY